MLKVAVVGDRDSVSGFKAIGMEVFIPYETDESVTLMKKLCESEEYAVVFITEEYAVKCKEIIKKYEDFTSPAIILIPGVRNNTGEGMLSVNQSVERAVGSQLPE